MAKPRKSLRDTAVSMAKEIELWPIERLEPFALNPRLHSHEQVEQIVSSVKTFGWTNPILVRGNVIIAGHGRLLAAKALALAVVPVIRCDHLTPEQAEAYVVADNKLALNASWDYDVLRELLPDLIEKGVDPTVTGFDTQEIDAIMNGWQPEFDQPHPGNGDTPLVARITVTCDPAVKTAVMDMLRAAIVTSGIDGVEVVS